MVNKKGPFSQFHTFDNLYGLVTNLIRFHRLFETKDEIKNESKNQDAEIFSNALEIPQQMIAKENIDSMQAHCSKDLVKIYINFRDFVYVELEKSLAHESYLENSYRVDFNKKEFQRVLDELLFFEKQKVVLFVELCRSNYKLWHKDNRMVDFHKRHRVKKLLEIVYFVYLYYFNLLSNFVRNTKGYYYSVSHRKFKSLNRENQEKIFKQKKKFEQIKHEFSNYLTNFYDFWISSVLRQHKGEGYNNNFYCLFFKVLRQYIQRGDGRMTLFDRVNSNFDFLGHNFKFKYIKVFYFGQENYFEGSRSPDENRTQSFDQWSLEEKETKDNCSNYNNYNVFNIFYYFLNKYYPDMTDEEGIAYDYYYQPLKSQAI